jgi:UDP-GlcNAc3NAcA epimerase
LRAIVIVGARPQFIKAAPLCTALDRAPGDVTYSVVHTGQHYDDDMSAVFFDEMGIPRPERNLGIGAGTHGQMTGRMLEALDGLLTEDPPDWVIVFGDTNSTLAAALATAKLPTRLAHIEAGLRSFNRRMPEEINRLLTDHVSDICFAPTDGAIRNLEMEGIAGDRIQLVGDVMYDAVLQFTERAREHSDISGRAGVHDGNFVLATLHRAENTDDPARLRAALSGLAEVAKAVPVVLPMHPRTRKTCVAEGIPLSSSLRLLPPVGYLDMLWLEAHACVIVTDSGGVQKEAFFHGRPCVTLRDETEWVELLHLGWNRLAPPNDAESVRAAVIDAMKRGPGTPAQPYGAGDAAQRIVSTLLAR